MKKFIIGALVLLVGVPGFAFNFFNFLHFLAGVIPALMILGGAIAIYLGIEELKQSDDSGTTVEPEIQLGVQRIEKKPEKTKTPQETENASTLPEQPAESSTSETKEPAAEIVKFKGNVETLVFHTVECNFASGKNCSMDFAAKEAAEAQGYKPCKVCMPDT